MKREAIQQKFKTMVERARQGAANERRDVMQVLKGMTVTYPWLRDYARLLGLSLAPGLTREFPWLAPSPKALPAKTRHAEPLGGARAGAALPKDRRKKRKSCARTTTTWTKPPTPAGYEYRQCYKEKCHCMRGGAWHGPYRYAKRWRNGHVYSEYLSNETVNDVSRET